ncbi:MAG: hypothetical protein ACJA11_003089 [Glaciecola sp.]|jgi:hypothetical protein
MLPLFIGIISTLLHRLGTAFIFSTLTKIGACNKQVLESLYAGSVIFHTRSLRAITNQINLEN